MIARNLLDNMNYLITEKGGMQEEDEGKAREANKRGIERKNNRKQGKASRTGIGKEEGRRKTARRKRRKRLE